jgi:hypothetical protein
VRPGTIADDGIHLVDATTQGLRRSRQLPEEVPLQHADGPGRVKEENQDIRATGGLEGEVESVTRGRTWPEPFGFAQGGLRRRTCPGGVDDGEQPHIALLGHTRRPWLRTNPCLVFPIQDQPVVERGFSGVGGPKNRHAAAVPGSQTNVRQAGLCRPRQRPRVPGSRPKMRFRSRRRSAGNDSQRRRTGSVQLSGCFTRPPDPSKSRFYGPASLFPLWISPPNLWITPLLWG